MICTAIMVHGAGGGGWQWRVWDRVFAVRGLRVLAPDLRAGDGGLEGTDFHDYQRQVLDWYAMAAGPVCLIGASLGGLLALAAAAERPAQALILVNPMPPSGVQPRPSFVRRPPRVDWSVSSLAGTRADLLDAELQVARWAHARWRDESGRVLNQAATDIVVQRPACPALVLAAADDADVPVAVSRATAQRLHADCIVIPGCGHLGVLLGRQAALAANLAADWLDALVDAGNRR